MYTIEKLFNPAIFQGKHKKSGYFEGWYYKLIDSPKENVLAIIPGIAYGKDKISSHAFIQVIDGINCKVHHFNYAISDFSFSEDKFEVTIGGNYFDNQGMLLDLRNDDISISGELRFHNIVPFPSTLTSPGIMGPFSFVPFMECYHGIVNIHHEIAGALSYGSAVLSLDGGYGYIEKDWGHSFPEAWIWLQSNHFEQGNVSIMFSIAKIPWLKKHFIGLISFLRIGDKLYRFATYTGARLVKLEYSEDTVIAQLEDSGYKLHIEANYSDRGSTLRAPKNGMMDREILETITGSVCVSLHNKNGDIVFVGEGHNTGMEMVGDLSTLTGAVYKGKGAASP